LIFTWFKKRRRRKIVNQPFPSAWQAALNQHVPHFGLLNEAEQSMLRELVQVFVAEKNWEGCKGLTVTDEMKVTIAGQACLLLLGIEHDWFRNVQSILIFPRQFVSMEKQELDEFGVIHESAQPSLGEAWENGPIILSWADSVAGGRNPSDGLNVVLHEFAHKLDLRDGLVNGVPPLADRREYVRWAEVMQREYDELVERSQRRKATLLDDYGTTNSGEFFAVAVECFFEKSVQMRARHPELYEVLSDYFKQDTAARIDPQ
jgi:Mlc titration factor MtfA (ptsG expression regulator)